MEDLVGKVAVVTGGARGLGAETCRALAGAGARVICADRRAGEAAATCEGIRAVGRSASALELDVSRDEQVREVIRGINEREGSLDVLVNNAGTDLTVPVEEMSLSDWKRILDTNLTGAFAAAKYAFPVMREQGGGHIVNIASTAAKRAWANASAYHASKWGLLGMGQAMLVEGRPFNIHVSTIVAGGMKTPFLLERFPDIDPGTLQDPAAVAEAVLFVLTRPAGTVIPEMMVLPHRESSWP